MFKLLRDVVLFVLLGAALLIGVPALLALLVAFDWIPAPL